MLPAAPDLSGRAASVAMCTYNGASFVGEQLQSLAAQTVQPRELVVVDDGSSDQTEAIVRAFARTARFPVHWYRNAATLGVVRNFERAIGLTCGEFVFLCDQDDVWLPEKIEKTLARFASPEVALVHTDGRLVDENLHDLGVGLLEALELSDRERRLFEQGRGYSVLLRRSLVTGATAALRRRVFDAARPFADGWVHDEWLALVAAMLGEVRRVDEPLLLYRQHGRNQIGARRRPWAERYVPRSRLGREHHRTQALRLEQMRDHLAARKESIVSEKIVELCEAMRHARFRAELPASFLQRFPAVMQELASGRYRRYSNGWKGALRDFVEPNLPEWVKESGRPATVATEQSVPHAENECAEASASRRNLRDITTGEGR